MPFYLDVANLRFFSQFLFFRVSPRSTSTLSSQMSLYNQPVVVDNGSGNIKSGFAGEEKPRAYKLAVVGRPRYQKIMVGLSVEIASSSGSSQYIGDAAQQNRGLLRLKYPIEHGVVTDWDDMELLWNHTYTNDLKAAPEEHPLLITEAPLNPRHNRTQMAQVLFEQFNIPCLYVLVQAVLSLYALGRTTGVVVDSGDGVTHVVPVFDGFALPLLIRRMDIAGRDVTEQFALQLRRSCGLKLVSSLELEVARLMKETSCYLLKDVAREERMASTMATEPYRLPDGHVLQLSGERFRAPEIMFRPEIIGDELPGIHELTANAISKTDLDLRATLYQHIVLSGGNTMLKGFGDRLLAELRLQQETVRSVWGRPGQEQEKPRVKIKIYAPPERKYTTWVGGSILAGLSTFKKMWVTQEEYRENPNVVHLRFL